MQLKKPEFCLSPIRKMDGLNPGLWIGHGRIDPEGLQV